MSPHGRGISCSNGLRCSQGVRGEEMIGKRVRAKIPQEGRLSIFGSSAAAAAASSTELEEGSISNWRPEEELV